MFFRKLTKLIHYIIVNKLEITEYEGVTKFALADELNAAKEL